MINGTCIVIGLNIDHVLIREFNFNPPSEYYYINIRAQSLAILLFITQHVLAMGTHDHMSQPSI